MTDKMIDANRALWNEWTRVHETSEFYDIAAFKAGRETLRPLEIEELGDVTGKSLLHLQCHFGQDTLSWARRGAQVTGSDLSDEAIALARALADELGIDARFIAGDIYELPEKLDERFDIVFTSWGVLAWLSDLPRWAQLIARFLKPGGRFYIAEIHPFAAMLDREEDGRIVVEDGYLAASATGPAGAGSTGASDASGAAGAAVRYEVESSYADASVICENTVTYQWDHSLGEVVSALAGAGLAIDFLHEWPFSVHPRSPQKIQADDGWWYVPGRHDLPLSFSLSAHSPA